MACNHEWVKTGMNRTWCSQCDSDGYWREGEVIITTDKSDDWDRKRRWRYRDDDNIDPVCNFDFNIDYVVSSMTYEP